MLTNEDVVAFRARVREYVALDRDGAPVAGDVAHDLVMKIPWFLHEIERLRANRPSCATCRFALDHNQYNVQTKNHVWCYQAEAFVRPEEANGKCLWEAVNAQ